jgi:hypothetical protein
MLKEFFSIFGMIQYFVLIVSEVHDFVFLDVPGLLVESKIQIKREGYREARKDVVQVDDFLVRFHRFDLI